LPDPFKDEYDRLLFNENNITHYGDGTIPLVNPTEFARLQK